MIKTITKTDLNSDSKLTSLTLSGINAAIADLRAKIDELSSKEIEECNLATYRTSDYHNSVNAVFDANRTELARIFLIIDDNQQSNDGIIAQQSGAYYGGGNYRFLEIATGQLKLVDGELVVDTSLSEGELPVTYYRVIRVQYTPNGYNSNLTVLSQWKLINSGSLADEINSNNTFWSGMIATSPDSQDLLLRYGIRVAGKLGASGTLKFNQDSEASAYHRGLMSVADKAKLDSIDPSQLGVTVDSSLDINSTNPVQNKTLAVLWDQIVSNFNSVNNKLNAAITTQNVNKFALHLGGSRYEYQTPYRPNLTLEMYYDGQTVAMADFTAPDTWLATQEAHGLMSASDKYKLDTLSISNGDVTAINTDDDTEYPDYYFIDADANTPSVQSKVKANPVAISKSGSTASTDITISGGVEKIYIEDPNSGAKYELNGVGDTVVTDNGTIMEVTDVKVNDDSSQTFMVDVTKSVKNTTTAGIETEYKVKTDVANVETTLVVSQAGENIDPQLDSSEPDGGYPIYFGFAKNSTVEQFTANLSADTLNSAQANLSSNESFIYPKSAGVLWYAAPQGCDYVSRVWSSDPAFVESNYVTNYSQWATGLVMQGTNNMAQVGTVAYRGTTYVVRAIYAAESLDIVRFTTDAFSTQEANLRLPMIRYIRGGAMFYRTDNVWVTSRNKNLLIEVDFCSKLTWSTDVDWIIGCTTNKLSYYSRNDITAYLYNVKLADMSNPDVPRVGHLVLSNGSTTFNITITQRRGELSTTATDMQVKANGSHYGSDGRAFTYDITTTNTYGSKVGTKAYSKIEPSADWIRPTTAGSDQVPSLAFDKNDTGSERTATVTIYGRSDEKPISFNVTQDALSYNVKKSSALDAPYGTWLLLIDYLSEDQVGSVYAENLTSSGTDTPTGANRSTVVTDGVTKAKFIFHLNNRTLDPQTWRIYFTVNGVTRTEDVTVAVCPLSITTPLWVPEVTKAGDTLEFQAYTACGEQLEAAFIGYRPIDYSNPIPVPLTAADEASLTQTSDVQVTLTPTTNSDDTLGYNWYNGTITIPASPITVWYAIVIGDGTRYSNGNLKSVRTFVIKQQDQ